MIDIEIILRPSRSWGMMYANSPDGRRWIIRHVGAREAGGIAATFSADLLKAYLSRATESGITIKVSGGPFE